MPAVGPRGGENPFKTHGGNNVRVLVKGKVVKFPRIKRGKSRRKDHRPHMQGFLFFRIRKIDGTGGADFFTGPAAIFFQVDACLRVNGIFQGDRLGIGDINRFSFAQGFIIFIVHFFRTF